MKQNRKFIIYCTPYCADCFRAIKIFEKLNIDFDCIDIEQDEDAALKVESINKIHTDKSPWYFVG